MLPVEPARLYPVEPLACVRPDPERWAPEPAPWGDEVLSSWLSRYAWASALGPQAFLHGFRRALGRKAGDVDTGAPDRFLVSLAQRTGIPIDRLRQTQRVPSPFRGLWEWKPCAPCFCPCCWADDPVPYIPWRWRVPWVRMCQEHGVWFRHDCPACGSPLSVLRGLARRALWECAACRHDLRRTAAVPAAHQAVQVAALTQAIMEQGVAIEREGIVEAMRRVVHGLHAAMNALDNAAHHRKAPAGQTMGTVVHGSWKAVYGLLGEVPFGAVRTHLLEHLQGSPFAEALSRPRTESIPTPPFLAASFDRQRGARIVRPAGTADIPAIRRFCRGLSTALDDDASDARKGSAHTDSARDLLDLRWSGFIEDHQPLAVGATPPPAF